jgi:hypothetical protein
MKTEALRLARARGESADVLCGTHHQLRQKV